MSDKNAGFWNTAAGMMTGIGTIVIAIAALITAIYQIRNSDDRHQGSTNTTTTSHANTPPTTEEKVPETTGASPTIQWQGSIRPSYQQAMDLDAIPVHVSLRSEDGTDLGVGGYSGDVYPTMDLRGAEAMSDPTTSNPSYEECLTAIASSPVEEVRPLKPGISFCSRTDEGNIAKVQVEAYNKDRNQVRLKVTVWAG